MKIILRGTMHTIEPIAINVPRPTERADKEDMVHSRPTFNELGQQRTAAYVPGHNLKGMFRTASVFAMADVLGAVPGEVGDAVKKLSLPVFASFHHGGLMGSKSESVDDLLTRRDNRRRNVQVSLFGSMPAKVKGSWTFGDVVFDGPRRGADSPVFEQYSARRDPIRKDVSIIEGATPEEIEGMRRKYEGNKATSAERGKIKKLDVEIRALNKKAVTGERTAADREKIAQLRGEIEAIKAKNSEMMATGEGSESVSRKDKASVVAAGLQPSSYMEFDNVDEAEFGFALLTMKHVSKACHVGAKTNTGHGRVRFDYEISVVPTGSFDQEPAGRVVVEPNSFQLESEHPFVLASLAAVDVMRKDPSKRLDLTVIPADF